MAQTITEGLFPSVAGLFSPVGTEQTQRLQAAGQPTNPLQAVSGSMGFLGERMQQGIGSAFGQMPQQDRKRQVFQQLVQQLGQQGVDISTSDGMVQLAQKLSSLPGFEGEALNLRQRAAQMAQQAQTSGLERQFKQSQIAKNVADTQKAQTEAGGALKVQSSKILPDGTTVMVFNNGKIEVRSSEGVKLEGAAAADAVKKAEQFGVSIAGSKREAETLNRLRLEAEYGAEIAGSKKAGEQAVILGTKAFEAVGKVRTNIGNLKSAKSALERGAKTGAIQNRLPDITAASVELRDIQTKLGLDVIGSVTFGALSEGELGLALNTALPMNLDEPELKDYIIRKIAAQEKLAKYLDDQAQFLSRPGNTLSKWLERGTKQPEGSVAKPSKPLSNDDLINKHLKR